MNFAAFKNEFLIFIMILPRLYASLSVGSFLSRTLVGGLLTRNGIVLSLALAVYPAASANFHGFDYSLAHVFSVLGKEVMIGIFIGYVLNVPFWIVEAAGELIDNQRGATIANSMNFLTDNITSPLGSLFSQAFITIFFSTGVFLVFLKGLYLSYGAWPVTEFMPNLNMAMADFFIKEFSLVSYLTVMIAGPVVIILFLSEFGLGLVGRFAPQLNVFFLALPVKSAVAIGITILYFTFMMRYFSESFSDMGDIPQKIFRLIYER
ncbi:MAG: type III secretion system export apparatus subunit SctT [Oligoflexales bacterium]|nr:type III secretion system export apparatus subunit SctT [Oligoflexales bacterium]